MNPTRRRAATVLGLMVASVAGAAAWRPTAKLADQRPKINLETLFPKSFADWRVDDRMPVQLISPDTQAVLDKIYNQTLSRTYVNATGQRIMLSVAYGGDQSDATRAHRPEVCYPAQGFQVQSGRNTQLDLGSRSIPARQLVARLGSRIEPITYWTTVGERIAVSGTEQKLAQLSYSMRGTVPDGMLVRASSIDANEASAFEVQGRFVKDLAAGLSSQLASLVVGK